MKNFKVMLCVVGLRYKVGEMKAQNKELARKKFQRLNPTVNDKNYYFKVI